jgi:ParB-like chromosome segregation protein Spo0J
MQDRGTTKLPLGELVIDPTVQIRRSNHEPTIRRYEEAFEKLPPVVVVVTPEGKLLADGFHRVAAAERLGIGEIDARVFEGTREDALELSVLENTKNADPLSPEERDDAIRRLKQLHPDWSIRQLAEAMSVSHNTIQRVFKVDEVKREVLPAVSGVSRDTPSDRHYREIARAPRDAWTPLARAASDRGWSSDATAQAVRNLKDPDLPEEHKRELLSGEADPVVRTGTGDLAVPADVIGRRIREMEANDAILAFQRALEELARARLFKVEAIVDPADARLLSTWERELPGDIAFLQEIVAALGERGQLRMLKRK